MRFRKLRIAWSVAWGVLAALLCVLWLKSFWWADLVNAPSQGTERVLIFSDKGEVRIASIRNKKVRSHWTWTQESIAARAENERKFIVSGGSITDREHGFIFRSGIVQCPHWSCVLLLTAIGALPWLTVKRFSLRTLLIATTLIALLLGIAVWAAQ